MGKWPADDQAALLRFYGTPGPDIDRQLVDVVPPFQMYYDGQPIKRIRFHRKAAPALAAALKEIWDHYGHDQKKIDALGISKYAGAYNPRKVRGSATKWSNHAYGAAIDLNAEENGFGKGHGNIPQPVIDAFKRQGARWGGDYRGRTDPMHFEFCDATGYPGVSKPLAFVDPPHTDGDSDTTDISARRKEPDTAVVTVDADHGTHVAETESSAEADAETRPSWLRRKWKGVTGWLFGGVGSVGLGWLTDPWVVVAIGAVVLAFITLFIIWMGPGDVRAWIRKQVS